MKSELMMATGKMGFEEIVQHKVYKGESAKIDRALLSDQLRRMLFEQLRSNGNLMTSAAWYLTEDQALKFAQMTLDELNDSNSNASKEMALLEEILAKNPFRDIIERDSINFIDLGCGNGIKADKILRSLSASQVNYYAVDTSPYMGLFCLSNLAESLLQSDKKEDQGQWVFVSAGQISDNAITKINGFNKEMLIEEIRQHKARLRDLQSTFLDLKKSKGMQEYLRKREAEWDILTEPEKRYVLLRDNKIMDAVTEGETALDRELQDTHDVEKVAKDIEHFYFLPWKISYAGVKSDLDYAEKLLFNVSTDSKDECRIFEQMLPQTLLDAYERRVQSIDSLFQDKEIMQLAKIALGSRVWPAFSEGAKREMEELKKDLDAREYSRVWGHLQRLHQDLHNATFIKTDGYRELHQTRMNGVSMDHVRHRGQGAGRPESPNGNDKEYFLCQPVSTQYCDFLNGDLMKLFRTVMFENSMSHSHQVVGLLGQTIGNFAEDGRKKIVKQIYDALEPGSYFMLGAELRPSEEDQLYQQKIQDMRKYYGAPELNDGRMGEGEKLLRYATKQLGIRDEDLEYKVDFNNNSIDMCFLVKNDGVKATYGSHEIPLAKDQKLLMATSHKFSAGELTNLVKDAGFTIEYNPDRYGYTVILARK